MGSEASVSRVEYEQGGDVASNQINTRQCDADSSHPDDEYSHKKSNTKILPTAYHGVWKKVMSKGQIPEKRYGQCHVYDEINDRLIIAYGSTETGKCLNDAWALSLSDNIWTCLNDELLGPRRHSSSVLVGRTMYVVGGEYEHRYYMDLHAIDIDSGKIAIIEVDGFVPSPRINPVIFHKESCIYMWAGFDGGSHGEVYMLGPEEKKWNRFEQNHSGRPHASFCHHKNDHYVFGSSKGHGLLRFYESEGYFKPVHCRGSEPSHELTRSVLIGADEYLFLLGGESESPFMHVYAFDINRKWWFSFHVRPDNETLSIVDGTVNKIGHFMLPREHSMAGCYRPKSRELVAVMGSKSLPDIPIFKLSIGDALSTLHLRSDLLEMLSVC